MPSPTNPDARFGAHPQTPAVQIWPGVFRRTIIWGDRAMVCEITLPRGTTVPAHRHPHEQCGYLVSGRLEFTIDGVSAVIERGGGWFVPGDAEHSVVTLEDSIAIDVFSPVRDEYK